MTTRRSLIAQLPAAAVAGSFALRLRTVFAADKRVTVGITVPLTGSDNEQATLIKEGAMMAVDEANAKGGVAGYEINALVLDNGTATAGQYDPAQAATNARKMVADPNVVAAVGPQNSGSGKAMAPILSQGNLATITPSSTNPDITDPKFAGQFRPMGKPIYFRTVTTDAYQGPNMANYFAQKLKVKKVFVLDDTGAYGVGIANAFEAQAKKDGMTVLGHDQVDPLSPDYMPLLTKIKGFDPDALYYGGSSLAGVKVVKQSYDVLPKIIKGGGDGVYGASLLQGAGYPAVEGWYATIAAPYLAENPNVAPWIKRYETKYGHGPTSYSFTAYDGMLVALDAIERVNASGKPVNRETVRDAIQTANLKTLQGVVSFDENGDIKDRTVSVFRYQYDDKYPVDAVLHQYKYLGVAPQTS
ncbi:MAG: branched-chain amino acid ABC transporter substrate-binding protein [Alphaproteobacteria bacterium]|nr:branched-chain amino acid ABC transporter substrate-binding protein [Alphaproteobacteria bacterium]